MAKTQREISESAFPRRPALIFATVGNDHRRFVSFERAVEHLARSYPEEHILFQHGHSNPLSVAGSRIENHKFLDRATFSKLITGSDVLFTHAGAGTLLQAVEASQKPIVMARRSELSEHINDHQLDILQEFSLMQLCYPVSTPEQAQQAFEQERNGARKAEAAPSAASSTSRVFLDQVSAVVASALQQR